MKKLFTLICALIGMTATVSAATVNDIKVCEHSYVLVMDNWTSNGTARPGKGNLFGDGFFLDLKGCSVAENKGEVDLSDAAKWGDAIATKYGKKYGSHRNSLRLKNDANMIAMRVKAGSKLIIFYNGNGKSGTLARIPKISSDAALSSFLNSKDAPTAETPAHGIEKIEWTAKDDGIIYIGSLNDDIFLSYIIVEVTETVSLPNEYNTYCAASSLDFKGNADVEAYAAKMNDSKTAVTLTKVDQVKKGAGVILKRVGENASATVTVIADDDADALVGNQLVGATEAVPAKTLADANAYILAGQKFCKVAADATGELAKGKAYLAVPAGVVPATLSFSIGELTGVESIEAQSKADNTEIYNIQGIRVKQPAKGLYIINGKKYAF